jgi:hypothetical protein
MPAGTAGALGRSFSRAASMVGSFSSFQTCSGIDALEADLDLVVEVLHGRPDLDHRDDLRGDVADDEVDALIAEAAHPLGIGITFRHAEKARQRHLGEDQVAGQGELEGAERKPLGRKKDAGRIGRPAGERVEPLAGRLRARQRRLARQPPDDRQGAQQGDH